MVDSCEIAATVLTPHFDAVRDVFSAHLVADGPLSRLRRTRFLVDPSIHDSKRHFAGCRQDGMLVLLAPEAAELPIETLVAILAHEFGHAADFAYPARWWCERDRPARWIADETTKKARTWRKAWPRRNDDQMEWDADSIVYAVTGRKIGYCGPCHLQCWTGGSRPEGLR